VDVAVAQPAPVDELDAQLEGGAGLAHELVLVELEGMVVDVDERDRGLAHAHGADVVGLDQRDLPGRAQQLGQRGGGHPAGGAAAGHDDALDVGVVHAGACSSGGGGDFPPWRAVCP